MLKLIGFVQDPGHVENGIPGVSGPDNDRTIFPTSLCGPKISGPDNNHTIWSFSGPKNFSGPDNNHPGGHCLVLKFQVWSWSLSGPVTLGRKGLRFPLSSRKDQH